MSFTRVAAGAAAALILACPSALAHEREFTLSRDWFLPYQGESEIESRTFWDTLHGSVVQEFEYEYGITDWFAVEPGFEIAEKRDDEGSYEIEGIELELRFHFWEFAYERILPALNVEFEHPSESDEKDSVELKFILSRYGEDGQDFAVNLNGGTELTKSGEETSEVTFGYVRPFREVHADSSAYFRKEPRFGVEAVHDFDEHFDGAGPLFIYRPTTHLNILSSFIFGLNDRDENGDELRLILEWEF